MVDYFPWTDGEILYADALNQSLGYGATITQNKIAATDVAGSTTFASPLKFAIVRNLGANTVYIRTDTTATTSYYALTINSSVVLNGGSSGLATLYYICGAGETADVRVLGTY